MNIELEGIIISKRENKESLPKPSFFTIKKAARNKMLQAAFLDL